MDKLTTIIKWAGRYLGWILFGVIFFAAIGALGFVEQRYGELEDLLDSREISLNDKTESLKIMVEKLNEVDLENKKVKELSERLAADALDKLTELENQNKELASKLERLKTKEDLARRDLEAYILKKYRTIPDVVAKEVAAQVVKLTKEEGVPFSLIVGLIEVESHFKPWAVSKKGARGLMQVMPFWVKNKKVDLGIKSKYELHSIKTNIKAGIKVFKYHLKETDNDINKGLYFYVGKDNTYANKVFNAMGRFEIFRSTLDTTLRDEANRDTGEGSAEEPEERKKVILKNADLPMTFNKMELPVTSDTFKKKISMKYKTFNKEAYARANKTKSHDMGILGPHAKLFRS